MFNCVIIKRDLELKNQIFVEKFERIIPAEGDGTKKKGVGRDIYMCIYPSTQSLFQHLVCAIMQRG